MFSNLNVLRLNLILGVFSALKFKKKKIIFLQEEKEEGVEGG